MKNVLRHDAPESGAETSFAQSCEPPQLQQSRISVEAWQGSSTVKHAGVGCARAGQAVCAFLGNVQIFEQVPKQAVEPAPPLSATIWQGPFQSPVKLNVQITNVPEVSQGLQSFDDVSALGVGITSGLGHVARNAFHYLATPRAVTNSLMQIGPALDNAVNYYANTPPGRVLRDAQRLVAGAGQTLEYTLGHALTPEQRGEREGAAMPMFFPIGARKGLVEKDANSLEAKLTLKETTDAQLRSLTVRKAAGAGGDWPVINERSSPDVPRQIDKTSCVAACGEMLSGGAIDQATLMERMGFPAPTQFLARHLGSQWVGKVVHPNMLDKLLERGSWVTELREPMGSRYARLELGHAVVVDGIDHAGNIRVRDPAHGTRYEMTRGEFTKVWTGIVVFRK